MPGWKNPRRAPAGSRSDVPPWRLKPSAPRRSRCRHRSGHSSTDRRPGVGLEDTGRAWPEPPRERVTSVSTPHPHLPSPIPVAPPGRDLGTGRPQLCWALVLHLGDELLGRPAPPPHSRHARSSGSPRRCEDELGVLGALATPLLSGLRSPPPGDRRVNSLLPLSSGFLLLRRQRYLESNPYASHHLSAPVLTYPEGRCSISGFCLSICFDCVLKQGLST